MQWENQLKFSFGSSSCACEIQVQMIFCNFFNQQSKSFEILQIYQDIYSETGVCWTAHTKIVKKEEARSAERFDPSGGCANEQQLTQSAGKILSCCWKSDGKTRIMETCVYQRKATAQTVKKRQKTVPKQTRKSYSCTQKEWQRVK